MYRLRVLWGPLNPPYTGVAWLAAVYQSVGSNSDFIAAYTRVLQYPPAFRLCFPKVVIHFCWSHSPLPHLSLLASRFQDFHDLLKAIDHQIDLSALRFYAHVGR